MCVIGKLFINDAQANTPFMKTYIFRRCIFMMENYGIDSTIYRIYFLAYNLRYIVNGFVSTNPWQFQSRFIAEILIEALFWHINYNDDDIYDDDDDDIYDDDDDDIYNDGKCMPIKFA